MPRATIALLLTLALAQSSFAASRPNTAAQLHQYCLQLSRSKPIQPLTGLSLEAHQAKLRQRLLNEIALNPLPKRIPLDVHKSKKIDHPWCVISRVHYQIWPGVYASGLLYFPKNLDLTAGPALLCPHGHWASGNADPDVQRNCLNFARLGYVVFSPDARHYEDIAIGISYQTTMVWTNMRALDYLETLPIDKERIGVVGASGGGLQSELLVALDDRIKAAAIVGYTSDLRHTLCSSVKHCGCNHVPDILTFTDHPEISTLGLRPVLYVTMNDWTRSFSRDNFPQIKTLYKVNGVAMKVRSKHFNSKHNFDRLKREETYAWMELWIGDKTKTIREPLTTVIDEETLTSLNARVADAKPDSALTDIFTQFHFQVPTLKTEEEFAVYRKNLRETLQAMLGTSRPIEKDNRGRMYDQSVDADGICKERWTIPTEGPISCPVSVFYATEKSALSRRPMTILFSTEQEARALAKDGSLVLLPTIRMPGQLLPEDETWDRKGMTWGRPVYGMAVTDLHGIADGIASRSDADTENITVVVRNSGALSLAAILAAVFDSRFKSLDLDFAGTSFETRQVPVFARVLHYGDALQFASLLPDRNLIIRNLAKSAGDPNWLSSLFALEKRPQAIQFSDE